MDKYQELLERIEKSPARSAWARGVREYAVKLVDDFIANNSLTEELLAFNIFSNPDSYDLEKELLNGCKDWKQYSRYGCGLVYNHKIAKRLCAPWELKKTRNGERNPNQHEDWLDCEARALFQAWMLIKRIVSEIRGELQN